MLPRHTLVKDLTEGKVTHPGSPNTPLELVSPSYTPEKGGGEREENSEELIDHEFHDATVPLAKLLPKIKSVAFK